MSDEPKKHHSKTKPRHVKVPSTMPLQGHVTGNASPLKESDPFLSSAFQLNTDAQQTNLSEKFNFTGAGYTALCRDIYAIYAEYDQKVVKNVLPEAMMYYFTNQYWFRLLTRKKSLQYPITQVESKILSDLVQRRFNIPHSLHSYLSSIGEVTAKNGDVLYPEIPQLPTSVKRYTIHVLL